MRRKLSAVRSQRSARGAPKPPSRRSGVRIIGGEWKGRRLDVPRDARPTSGRARKALFDILQDSVDGARVLDLFAGSGAVGLEALSRGASAAVLVEKDDRALAANVARLRAAGRARVLPQETNAAVLALARRGESFDLVFADPPYASGGSALSRSVAPLVAPGGRLVIQTDATAVAPDIAGLTLLARRAYARNVFWFFGRVESPVAAGPFARGRAEW